MGRLLLVVKWMKFAQDSVISIQTKEKCLQQFFCNKEEPNSIIL